jgi:hypothetical protein
MVKRRFKPTSRNIDLSKCNPQDLEFYCKTSYLDEILCKKLKRSFNKILSEGQEQFVRHYMIVKTNSEYTVISGVLLEPWLEKNGIKDLQMSTKAKACVDHFIQARFLEFQ